MMRKYFLPLVGLLALSASCSAAEPAKSTQDDQKSVAVTVYNSSLGLIKDTRSVRLAAGQGELRFTDVAALISPVTVSVRALGDPKSFRVLEQNYEYDLVSPEKVLEKYVGKNLKIVTWNDFQNRKDTVEATLLNSEGQIYKINDEIYLGYPGLRVVPEIPGSLVSKPTLTWLYENKAQGPLDLEVSYLTAGIGWQADYAMTIDANGRSASLSGWVTIDNKSGAVFKDARLKLVAGEVHRADPSFSEYHVYDLERKTTIQNNQAKQIRLLESSAVAVQKEYRVTGGHAQVFVKFFNSKTNQLGVPLPAGTFRLYEKDPDSSQQFVGEYAVRHTPAEEGVELLAGEAFDVTAERRRTDFKQVSPRSNESEWEITLKNRKSEDVTVAVIEPLTGDWRILSSSHPFKKTDAVTARADVSIPKNGEVRVKYRAVTQY